MRTQVERQFWIKSKWLARGALCCLCKNGEPIMFGEIMRQQFRKPVSDSKRGVTDSLEVAISDKDGFQAIFDLLNNDAGKDKFELAAACAAYFAYKPVLQALQTSADSELLAYIASDDFSKFERRRETSSFIREVSPLVEVGASHRL
jgi:hypothetical protein